MKYPQELKLSENYIIHFSFSQVLEVNTRYSLRIKSEIT